MERHQSSLIVSEMAEFCVSSVSFFECDFGRSSTAIGVTHIFERRAAISNQSSVQRTGRVCLFTNRLREKPVLPNTSVWDRLQERLR